MLFPYLEERTILRADLRVLRTLVESYYPLTASFEDEFRQVIESKGKLSILSNHFKSNSGENADLVSI